MPVKERKKLSLTRPELAGIILLALSAAGLAAYYIFRASPGFADSVVTGFSMPARLFLGRVFSHVSFSVTEIFYAAVILFAVFFLVSSIIRVVKSRRKLRTALRRALALALAGLYIWTGYCWLWGVDYYSQSFSEKSGFSAGQVTAEDLYYVTARFAVTANALSGEIERDEDGHFAEDMDGYFAKASGIYENLFKEFPVLEGRCYTPKKMLASRIMSYLGFTGLYFPFTGESNLNVDSPGCMIPATIAHELAHQLGVYSEQECNFLGVAACIASEDTVYKYSGVLCGLTYLMNALYKTDREAWSYLRSSFTPELETDWQDNSAYWAKMKTFVDTISTKVYDSYLKGNGQTMGILSYSACVTMLVEYYK